MKLKKTITIVTGPMAGHGGEETVVTKFINEFSGKIDFNLYISQIIGDTTVGLIHTGDNWNSQH